MSKSISKKRVNVKRVSKKKQRRYTQKVDSLGRRYTIDNETGKRVSNENWERERATSSRKKTKASKKKPKAKARKKSIPRNTESSKPKAKVRPKSKVKKPSRKPKVKEKEPVVESIPRNTPPVHPNLVGFDWSTVEDTDDDSFLFENAEVEAEIRLRAEIKDAEDKARVEAAEEFIPPSRIHGFASNTIIDRAEQYPKVKAALEKATDYARFERDEVAEAETQGRPPTRDEHIRARFLLALEQDEDLDNVSRDLAEMFDYEVHDIYEIYFSPEVA